MTRPVDTRVLLEPFQLNHRFTLGNRILLAPCTRNCADPGLIPTAGAIDYYTERAAAGLVITEATLVRRDCQGYRDTPGIYSAAQVEAWARVTESVHRAGGLIFSQLWHVGRLAHPYYTGVLPAGPSRVRTEGRMRQTQGAELHHVWPRAFDLAEIPEIVASFARGAENALAAGFDGVEIHGANGYLLEQFLRQLTNRRHDAYGGSPENRARFALEVVDAVIARAGAERVGLRLSPAAYFGLMEYTESDVDTYLYLLSELQRRKLAYLHVGIIDDAEEYPYLGGRSSAFLRQHYDGVLVGNGGYAPDTAARAIAEGAFDLISFGKLFIANPDLVARLREGLPLETYQRALLDRLR